MIKILFLALLPLLAFGALPEHINTREYQKFVEDGVDVAVRVKGNIITINPVNGSGSGASATVSTVSTITAPANAVGFILMNLDTSTTNMRWAVGRTASVNLGQQLQPGRDTGFVPVGANISIIAESGTCNYDIQWVVR